MEYTTSQIIFFMFCFLSLGATLGVATMAMFFVARDEDEHKEEL